MPCIFWASEMSISSVASTTLGENDDAVPVKAALSRMIDLTDWMGWRGTCGTGAVLPCLFLIWEAQRNRPEPPGEQCRYQVPVIEWTKQTDGP